MTANIKVDYRDVVQRMRSLSNKLQKQIARKAIAEGAEIIRKEALSRVSVRTGLLKSNIIKKSLRSRNPGRVSYVVGARRAKAVYGNTKANVRKGRAGKSYWGKSSSYYAHMVEFGTRKMRARPFLRPAFESKKNAAFEAINQRIVNELDKVTA